MAVEQPTVFTSAGLPRPQPPQHPLDLQVTFLIVLRCWHPLECRCGAQYLAILFWPCWSFLSSPARRRSRPLPPLRGGPWCAPHYCAPVGTIGGRRRGLHRRHCPHLCVVVFVGTGRPARAVKTKILPLKCAYHWPTSLIMGFAITALNPVSLRAFKTSRADLLVVPRINSPARARA